jgi:hypothetical protein
VLFIIGLAASTPTRRGPLSSNVSPLMHLRGLPAVVLLLAATGHAQERATYTLEQLNVIGRALASERCHRPVEVKTSFVRNPNNRDIADEMRSFDCRTFRVAIYRSLSASPARELPMAVTLEGEHPLAKGAWTVGASAASVRSVLGAPARVFGESMAYSLDAQRPGRDTLTFEVAAGVVHAVSWSWELE